MTSGDPYWHAISRAFTGYRLLAASLVGPSAASVPSSCGPLTWLRFPQIGFYACDHPFRLDGHFWGGRFSEIPLPAQFSPYSNFPLFFFICIHFFGRLVSNKETQHSIRDRVSQDPILFPPTRRSISRPCPPSSSLFLCRSCCDSRSSSSHNTTHKHNTMAMAPTERRKPFTNWVKKLNQKMKRTKGLNNPYPQSGHVSNRHAQREEDGESQSTDYPQSPVDGRDSNPAVHSTEETNRQSIMSATSDSASADIEGDDRTPTTAPSYGGTSLAGTMITATDPRRADSTFSSPAPSARSVATTLSTIQSQMANGVVAGAANNNTNQTNPAAPPTARQHQHESVQYSQPQALVTAMPPGDRNPRNQYRPATYSAIIANNLLNDNISILTLASSTQRRRRRSWDTDYDHASVRALPPSQFGGSRESLPLSVLSANLDGQQPTSPGLTTARSIAERSVSGITAGHGRADSLNGSIGGGAVPVASES